MKTASFTVGSRALSAALIAAAAAASASANVRLELVGPSSPQMVGDLFTVDVLVNVTGPVGLTGLGFDVNLPPEVELVRAGTAPGFATPFSADGDNLAALVVDPTRFATGILGESLVMTLFLRASERGVFGITPSFTPSDPTEGFARAGGGLFTDFELIGTDVVVVPTPGSLALGAACGLVAARRRRRR